MIKRIIMVLSIALCLSFSSIANASGIPSPVPNFSSPSDMVNWYNYYGSFDDSDSTRKEETNTGNSTSNSSSDSVALNSGVSLINSVGVYVLPILFVATSGAAIIFIFAGSKEC